MPPGYQQAAIPPGYARNAREFSRVGNAGVKFRDGHDDIEVVPAKTGDAIILRVNGSFSKSVTILRYRSGGGVKDGLLEIKESLMLSLQAFLLHPSSACISAKRLVALSKLDR